MNETYKLVYSFILDNQKKFPFTIRKAASNPPSSMVLDLADMIIQTQLFSPEYLNGSIVSVDKIEHVKTTEKEFVIS